MMEDRFPITIELFIALIEDRPIIWDKSLDDYKNKTATQNAWREILLVMYPDFETWDEKKRQEYAKKTVKKWTYIRDTFMKSEKKIEAQKTSGSREKTAKPYVYHKQLLFLKKNTQPFISVSSIKKTTESNEGDTADAGNADDGGTAGPNYSLVQNDEAQLQKHQSSNDAQADPTQSTGIKRPPIRRRLPNSNLSAVDAKMIKFMDSYQSQNSPINRHISFFNGLLPTLDKFNDDQILDFQLGVIKLTKDIKKNSSTQEQTSSTESHHSSSMYTGYFTAEYANNTSTRSTHSDTSPVSQDSMLSSYSSDDCSID